MLVTYSNFKKVFYLFSFSFFIAHASSVSLLEDVLAEREESKQCHHCQNISASNLTCFKGDHVASTFRTIKELSMSGSQQYTADFLKEKIIPRIMAEAGVPLKNIIFVDLREEPHFMLSGNTTVAIEGACADYYRGVLAEEVMAAEQNFVKRFSNYLTEKECVEEVGAKYLRIAVTDINRPEDSDVDEFLKFLQKLKEKEESEGEKYWLHFHCLVGHGRTTTFMSMYEMLKTSAPDMLSFKEILEKQHKIGGADLLNMWYAPSRVEWVNFLENFYQYAKDQESGYRSGLLWSEWVALKKLSTFQERPADYSWWSLRRAVSNIQAFVMVNSMKISQVYQYMVVGPN